MTNRSGIDQVKDTREWYAQYYEKKGEDRNNLLRNPEVLFQYLAKQIAVIQAIAFVCNDRSQKDFLVLDVGCGGGRVLSSFCRWVFSRKICMA
jgi:2-polyprenyl-3-methyl-5-hydroxy-6-metoxy-1,4-benzoquinol methylase